MKMSRLAIESTSPWTRALWATPKTVRFLTAWCCLAGILLGACTTQHADKLPILGHKRVEGEETIYHTIPPFAFIDQDSGLVTNKTFDNKMYVADFFFTSCQTICPIMKTQMARVYEAIKSMDDVALLSHTIDPKYDSVELLHDYAQRMGVNTNKWHFVTGVKDSIYKIAQNGYFATAMEDQTAPGGFVHSGAFLLIDKDRRIRGKYDGTDEKEVNHLLQDIEQLRHEYE